MTIDERALTAAVEAYVQKIFGISANGLMPDQHELIDKGTLAAIEAYEVALWRPIEEAPRDKSWVLALFKNSKSGPGMIRWDGDGWIDSGLQVFQPSYLKKRGAMSRTITPPPQNGD